jgi:hypothetical protein
MDDVSTRLSCRGGDAGGVTGRSPAGHTGMCLLGMAVGVPRVEVLRDRCVAGVELRLGMGGALATAAAMLARCWMSTMQLKARDVEWVLGKAREGLAASMGLSFLT